MTDDEAMAVALAEAEVAVSHGDVPVGAVVLVGGEVVAARHNERERAGDPTAHAELLALRDAAESRGDWRLVDATLVHASQENHHSITPTTIARSRRDARAAESARLESV